MEFEPETTVKTATDNLKLEQPLISRKPLELLRDTEALLRRPTVTALVPILPPKVGAQLRAASYNAEESLQELATIDLDRISDREMRSVRIRVGLSFVGFGALMNLILLLYLHTLHPELTPVQQIGKYWYEYVWFVCLGVAGMFILGREAMRPQEHLQQ